MTLVSTAILAGMVMVGFTRGTPPGHWAEKQS